MTYLESIVLGVVQGVTEFLPISSTAHLRIVPALAGWTDPGAAFTAVLQLGTLAAVLAYFARDLLSMLGGVVIAVADPTRRRDPNARLALYLVVGTLPVVVAGVLFKDAIHGPWRALPVIASALIVVGIALAWVERRALRARRQGRASRSDPRSVDQDRSLDTLSLRDVLIIGGAQALALVPGVSRSGITMLAAMAIGFRRDAAARFSFLLSIPAIAGAGIFEMKHVLHSDAAGAPLLIGLAVATVTGYGAIAWLLKFLRTRTMIPFVIYRIGLGLAILALVAAGLLQP